MYKQVLDYGGIYLIFYFYFLYIRSSYTKVYSNKLEENLKNHV